MEENAVAAARFLANEAWREEHLRAAEALASNCVGDSLWELVGLLFVGNLACLLHLNVEVQGDVSQLLLDVTHDLTLGGVAKEYQRTVKVFMR